MSSFKKYGFILGAVLVFLNIQTNSFALPLGAVECKPTPTSTGYFIAYFEEVAIPVQQGYNDKNLGQKRRNAACSVLVELAQLLNLEGTHAKPEILFEQSPANVGGSLPPTVLAAASSYFLSGRTFDNGDLYRNIISGADPVPGLGNFDAFIITNFYGSLAWDIDSTATPPLNANTYSYRSTILHEMLHALGFCSLLPSVIKQNNLSIRHGTFDLDLFAASPPSSSNAFLNPTTQNMQTAAGAPPAWFTSNKVVYQGKLNTPTATPIATEIRPIYSPTTWQEGSSLSHFDMGRAALPTGEAYVMHPSIETGKARNIHKHEKEVLCHIGYSVTGMLGCTAFTPAAQDDYFVTAGTTPVCVNPLDNDKSANAGAVLSIYNLNSIQSNPGDVLTFYSSRNCVQGTVISTAKNAKSFNFAPSALAGARFFSYQILDSVSNRISAPAQISNVYCGSDPKEYICNGDFEIGLYPPDGQIAESCPSDVPGWCNFRSSVDMYSRESNFLPPWMASSAPWMVGAKETYSGAPNNRYVGGWDYACNFIAGDNVPTETLFTQTISPLSPGNYQLTWFNISQALMGSNPVMRIIITDRLPHEGVTCQDTFLPVSTDLVYQVPLTINTSSTTLDWLKYTANVVVPSNGIQYRYVVFVPRKQALRSGPTGGRNMMDGVSLKQVASPNLNTINGKIYSDVSNFGVMDSSETGLADIQVGLFKAGQVAPIMTATTSKVPFLGQYQFANLSNGTYYVALIDEKLFPTITQPAVINDLVKDHSRVYTVPVQSGQTVSGKNFGVALVESPKVDIAVDKSYTADGQGYIYYTILITNTSAHDAHNVLVNDLLPKEIQYIDYTRSTTGGTNPTYTPLPTGDINIGTLNAKKVATVTIRTKVTGCNTISNTVRFSKADEPDTNTGNDSKTVSFGKTCTADLSVKKTVDDKTLAQGYVTYKLRYDNAGPQDANGIDDIDALPAGLSIRSQPTFTGSGATSPTYTMTTDGKIKISIAKITPKGFAEITVQVNVSTDVCGTITNTVKPNTFNSSDPNMNNNTSTVPFTKVCDATAPSSPGNPFVPMKPMEGVSFTVTWTASTDAGSGIKSYEVYRSSNGGGTFVLVRTVNGNAYLENGMPAGLYVYKVRAQDNAGNFSAFSGNSNTVVVLP